PRAGPRPPVTAPRIPVPQDVPAPVQRSGRGRDLRAPRASAAAAGSVRSSSVPFSRDRHTLCRAIAVAAGSFGSHGPDTYTSRASIRALKFDIITCYSGFSRLVRCAEHHRNMADDNPFGPPIGGEVPATDEDVAVLLDSEMVDDDYLPRALGLTRSQRAEFAQRYSRLPIAERPALSPFFDAAWYLSQHEDVRLAGVDPLLHFVEHGIFELRSPHPLIS